MDDHSYEARVHVVMDHVRRNLRADLSLTQLAKVAHFSPYHFHRIFGVVTGETVAGFTRRARLERAVALMRGAPRRELGSIASEVGFATPSEFSRVFKNQFGQPPSSWDRISGLDGSAMAEPVIEVPPFDWHGPPPTTTYRPACRVAYVRIRDPWRGRRLADGYERLLRAVAGCEVGTGPASKLVGMSWESAQATPYDQLTYDLGLTVDDSFVPAAELGIHDLPSIMAVELPCSTLAQTAAAWDHLYRHWLPASRYEPDEVPAIKWFLRLPDRADDLAPPDGVGWQVECSIALRPRRP